MKKLGPVKLAVLIVLAVCTVCSYVFYDYIFGENNVFAEAATGSGFLDAVIGAVPKLIACVQIVSIVVIVTTVVLVIIGRLFCKSQRSLTVARLVCNLIKWIIAVVLVIVVLAVWGVDTTALITGAGVITLVVGLGMQSLIEDVVAGLFIVFENEFNVGDIITVDGFRGEVVSIGIRTTKLRQLGNIKIYNNSDIRSVLNQTAELSVGRSWVIVEYGSLPLIEGIVSEHLPKLEVEGVIGKINFDGVDVLGASGATLQFSASCREPDFYAVQRRMNLRLTELLTAHGVKIALNMHRVQLENGEDKA